MAKNNGQKTGVIVGVDTGYSATKLYTEVEGKHRIMIFPSVVGRAEFAEDFLDLDGESDFIASFGNPGIGGAQARNFGETAVRFNRGGEATTDREEFTQVYNPALTLAGLARLITEKNVPVPETLVVRADADQLFRVLSNLVRNAAQAIEAAGRPGSVTVVAAEAAGGSEIRVRDTGPGLPYYPGRMAPTTALNFVLLGIALPLAGSLSRVSSRLADSVALPAWRPPLTTMTGFMRAAARAADMNLRGAVTASM